MEKVISMSQLAKDPERIARDIETRKTLYRVRRSQGSDLMLMDRAQYDSWIATLEFIAQHPRWEQELKQADQEYAHGKFIPLATLLSELEREEAPPAPRRRSAARARTAQRRAKSR